MCIYGRFYPGGGGVISGVLTQSGRFFLPFLDFRPEVGMHFAQKLAPPYFGHGEFKNQGFVAQQNGGGAIRCPEHGRFSGNLLLLVWRTYRVFTVLGPVLKHIVTMANFSELVNYAELHAESTAAAAGPTLQLNDIVEKITRNCWQCSLQKSS